MEHKGINIISTVLQYRARIFWGLLFLVVFCSLIVRWQVTHKYKVPRGDECSWMRLAIAFPGCDFMQSRDVEHDLYFERTLPHPEDNRSPLYPILISWCQIFPDPYLAAQLFSIIVFVVLACYLSIILFKRIGSVASIACAVYMGCSPLAIIYSVQVYPDLLFVLGIFLIAFHAPSFTHSLRNSILGGSGLALLVLLKTTGIFLLPVVVYVYFIKRHEKGIWIKLGAFFGIFILMIFPWCLRNYIHFGSPFYQFSGYNLWVDGARDMFIANTPRPSFQNYLSKHGFFFIIFKRPLAGFLKLIRGFNYFDHYLSLYLLPFALTGVLSVIRTGKLKSQLYNLLVFSFFYFPLMIYLRNTIHVTRYVMIYYVLIYLLAGIGIHYILTFIKNLRLKFVLLPILVLLPLMSVVYPLEYYISNRGSEAEQDKAYRGIVQQVKATLPENAIVLSRLLHRYYYLHNISVINIFNFIQWEDLYDLLRDYKAGYAFVDSRERDDINRLAAQSNGTMSFEFIDKFGSHSLHRIILYNKPILNNKPDE